MEQLTMQTNPVPQVNFRYAALADEIQDKILSGQYRAGEKLPSLRKLHNRLGLSISTIHQAYIELEKRGRVEARQKSGFFVRPLEKSPLPLPVKPATSEPPSRVRINDLAETIVSDLQRPDIIRFGAAVADQELMPLKQLSRIAKSMSVDEICSGLALYDDCAGAKELRYALAKMMMGYAGSVAVDEIITTNGCLEAVSLCLRAVAGPGDVILMESPVFHCFLQLIEDLGMYVIELPGCPEKGMSPDAFESMISDNRVKACLLNPNFHNPLGSVMPTPIKKAVLKIANHHGIPIIEDDIYGDIFFGTRRPSTFKGLDTTGNVLYCSSFSKTIAPGLRAGWTLPGKFYKRVMRLKLNSQLASPNTGHIVAARFIESGAYERHLRRLRNQIKNQVSAMSIAVAAHFPKDTRITFPLGGMFLWIELNKTIDAMDVFHKARQKGISFMPGIICSTTDRYKHCMRLSCGLSWSDKLEKSIAQLGRIVCALNK
ncbi:PLP-dependent aminotransferase family protein [uncultured Desulfobacter sp.]|uniref:aminotransferase-like domain-containing protein n=1 Tax=uncultured Desulfobacter sp. TaxID=240139 RepID=UPI0029F54526|nr:PLP-dependent aminotransferase family protein [uncultured Desulfobacter sp.]